MKNMCGCDVSKCGGEFRPVKSVWVEKSVFFTLGGDKPVQAEIFGLKSMIACSMALTTIARFVIFRL